MIKNDCPHFPCHKGLEDCIYCYCPLYPCKNEKLGKWIKNKNGKIWDCSDCNIFHKKKVVESMKQIIENQNIVHSCVCCGYCCKQRPCGYGIREKEGCAFLQVDDVEIMTYKCVLYDRIVKKEKNSNYPMFDCGCSSSLFNTIRNKVIRKTREKIEKGDRL